MSTNESNKKNKKETKIEAEGYQDRLAILPIRFRNIKCDKPDMVRQGQKESMFITGTVGVGKTVLMAGIVKEILKDSKRNPIWISYPSFIMRLQSLFQKDSSETPFEEAKYIATYPDTLCIDDIGVEKMTPFVQQITYYIINYREMEMLHTVITSNFSLKQISNQIDDRISSRIVGMCKMIKLTGEDRRVERKNKGEIKERDFKIEKSISDIEEEAEFEPGSHINFREEWKKKK